MINCVIHPYVWLICHLHAFRFWLLLSTSTPHQYPHHYLCLCLCAYLTVRRPSLIPFYHIMMVSVYLQFSSTLPSVFSSPPLSSPSHSNPSLSFIIFLFTRLDSFLFLLLPFHNIFFLLFSLNSIFPLTFIPPLGTWRMPLRDFSWSTNCFKSFRYGLIENFSTERIEYSWK